MGNPGTDLHPRRTQVRRDQFGRPEFSVGQFRILMDVASYLSDARHNPSYQRLQGRVWSLPVRD
jgi:hypothetical protein